MSGGTRSKNHRKRAAGIACGLILLAGLTTVTYWLHAAKVAGTSPLTIALATSARAAQPSFTFSPTLASQPLANSNPKRLTPTHGAAAFALPHPAAPSPSLSPVARAQAMKVFAGLPMTFEANNGQTDPSVKFLARAPGYTLFLADKEAVLSLPTAPPVVAAAHPEKHSRGLSLPRLETPRPVQVVRLKFAGASTPAAITGRDQLPGKTNYFIGNDPKQWRTNVPNYSAVEYRGIYPGVDARFRGDNRQLEFDFDVAPGADPSTVALEVQGARRMRVNSAGDVLLRLGGKRDVSLGKPHIYQQSPQGRREIAGHYVLVARNRIAFALSPYDHSKALVIDPTLAYSTYLGGSVQDSPFAIAADSSGSAYITGVSYSVDFPVTSGVYQSSCPETGQTTCTPGTAFVTKFSPDGKTLVYSTFLNGHTGADQGTGIAVDSGGSASIVGVERGELDFPTSTEAIQVACNTAGNPNPEVFVATLDPTGSNLVYSTCLQDPAVDASNGFSQGSSFPGGIAVDSTGNVYVTGSTDLPQNFPTTQTSFQTTCQVAGAEGCNLSEDPFVVKINPTGTPHLVYSTFLSGGAIGSQVTSNGIAVDSFGDAYVIGYDNDVGAYPSGSPGGLLTTLGSLVSGCPTYSCGGFLAKINGNATVLAYSTYLANVSEYVTPTAVAVDQYGNAYVTGYTGSTDFPSTQGVLQYYFTPPRSMTTNLEDGFVIKMNQLGDGYAYATLLGGTATDTIATGIAVDASGHAFVTGTTDPGFPTTAAAFQTTDQAGANQVFFSELDPIGASLLYSTFLAGTTGEAYDTEPSATGVSYLATDASGNAYVTGQTDSTNFPTTPGVFQTNSPLAGGSQSVTGFVAKFVFLDSALSISPTTLSAGTAGMPYGPITLTATGGSGADTFAVTAGSLPPGLALSSLGELSGTPTQTSSFPFTVTVTDSIGDTNSQTYTLQIGCPTIIVGPSTLAGGTNGTAYPAVTFTETGGVGTTTFSETGALPTGMTFVAGVLSGTPTQTGSFPLTVTATDSNGCQGNVSDTLTITTSTGPLPPQISSVTPNIGSQGQQNLQVTIAGANFVSGSTTVTFGGGIAGITVVAGSLMVTSSTSLTAVLNIAQTTPTGNYDVVMTVSGATPPATLTGGFTVAVPIPTINEPITVNDQVTVTPLINVTAPVASFSPGSLGFNSVSGTQTLTVSNIGTGPSAVLVINSAPTISQSSSLFAINQIMCSTGTANFPLSLPSGAACTLTISYAPSTSPPTDSGILVFNDNAALSNALLPSTQTGPNYMQSIALTGAGVNGAPGPPPPATIPIPTIYETIKVTDTVPPPALEFNTTTTITSTSSTFGGLSLPANLSLVGGTVTVGFAVKPVSGTATPTGNVNVIDGLGDNCGPSTLASGSGSCTLTISQAPPSGSAPLVATYTPDANSSSLLTSTSSPFMENIVQVTGCGPLPAAQSSSPGKTVTFTFSACIATDIFTAPSALVTGCPPSALCSAMVTHSQNNPFVFNIVVTVMLGSSSATVPFREPRPWGEPWLMSLFWLGILLAILMAIQMARQQRARPRFLYAAGFLLALVLSGIAGCTSASVPGGGGGTSPNTYTININVTDGGSNAIVPLTLTVTK